MPNFVTTASTCCGNAPSNNIFSDCLPRCASMRLPTKPSQTPTTAGTFAILRAIETAVVRASLSLQITGGSSTVPDAYEKMRIAGAVARDVLLQAAAKRTGIAKEELKTSNGSVITPRGEVLSYASLAAETARIDPPKDVRLEAGKAEWRYLGKAMQRTDIVAKSTGTATFGIDIKMPGMVYATVRTNPRHSVCIKGFDASAAEKSRGVIAIVPITGGVGVIADNTWRAFKAASLIKCDWGTIALSIIQRDHVPDGRCVLHGGTPGQPAQG